MANINFNKLNCKVNTNTKSVVWADQNIEICEYLPIQEKLHIMEEVISLSMSQYNYANPVQVEVYTYLCILKYYTNIKFTEKQLSEPAKLYDLVHSSGLLQVICDNLPEGEFDELIAGIDKSVKSFYAYRTSVLGILDVLKTDYSNLNLNIEEIVDGLKDPEALKALNQLKLLENGVKETNTNEENLK